MGPRTAWYARANSDHSRDAVPNSVAFCETTPIQGTVSDCHHPLGLGSCRVCPLERRRISYRITARPSASSKRACASGPMPALTAVQTSAQQSRLDGFIATIGTDLMAASAPSRPSPASPGTTVGLQDSCFGRALDRSDLRPSARRVNQVLGLKFGAFRRASAHHEFARGPLNPKNACIKLESFMLEYQVRWFTYDNCCTIASGARFGFARSASFGGSRRPVRAHDPAHGGQRWGHTRQCRFADQAGQRPGECWRRINWRRRLQSRRRAGRAPAKCDRRRAPCGLARERGR